MSTDHPCFTDAGEERRLFDGLKEGMTEYEYEMFQYAMKGSVDGEPYEKELVFGMIGVSSILILFIFSWVVFKKVWFVWLGMPGWW